MNKFKDEFKTKPFEEKQEPAYKNKPEDFHYSPYGACQMIK